MNCKCNQLFIIIHGFITLVSSITLSAQNISVESAPSGPGNQILENFYSYEDTLLMAINGDGLYLWENTHVKYSSQATFIFKTTLVDKSPMDTISLVSDGGEIEISHIHSDGNSFYIVGKYRNNLKINQIERITNSTSSSGLFVLKVNKSLDEQQLMHWEYIGELSLPKSLLMHRDSLIFPVSLNGELYYRDSIMVSTEVENLILLQQDQDSIASANAIPFTADASFQIGDCSMKDDTIFVVGQFRDSLITNEGVIYNSGTFQDPILLKIKTTDGILSGYSFRGAYPANAEFIHFNNDQMYITGEFIGNLMPDNKTEVSIGERPGIYIFSYKNNSYRDAHLLYNEAGSSISGFKYINNQLLLSFSYSDSIKYRNQKLNSTSFRPHFGILEIIENSGNSLYSIHFRGNGNFPYFRKENENWALYGTLTGMRTDMNSSTEELDIIHLRKQNNVQVNNSAELLSVNFYPQPAQNYALINEMLKYQVSRYEIYSIKGKLLKSGEFYDRIPLDNKLPQQLIVLLKDQYDRPIASGTLLHN